MWKMFVIVKTGIFLNYQNNKKSTHCGTCGPKQISHDRNQFVYVSMQLKNYVINEYWSVATSAKKAQLIKLNTAN